MKTKGKLMLAAAVAVPLLAAITLIRFSFSTIEYHEMAFKRSRTTGAVDTDKVYTAGWYLLGPDMEFKKFKASAHFVSFPTDVFTADRLEMALYVNFQYFIRPHQLKQLHATYDVVYDDILRANALAALKNAAPSYQIREYIRQRDLVEKWLHKAVSESLGGKCCLLKCGEKDQPPCENNCKPYDSCIVEDWGQFADVRYFQLGGIGVPTKLKNRFDQTLILQEAEEREQNLQDALIIRKETEQKAQLIENVANVVRQAAQANRTLILRMAENEGNLMRENARRSGLKLMYSDLNITSEKNKAAFDYLRTLRKSKWKRLAIDYTHYIAGGGQK